MTNNTDLKELSIRELLDGTDKYIIPIYQRNYAWEEKEIEQLLQDIIDYIPKKNNETPKEYYIGSLIINKQIFNNNTLFETIDGQQRLTTLSILTSILKNKLQNSSMPLDWYKTVNLDFFSRSQSTETLEAIFLDYFQINHIYNDGIINGFNLIHKHLDKKLNEAKISLETFSSFLYNNVKIIRVQVPEDTDLNHYFEIMNTRGEQLEKHEVLKATLLNIYNEHADDAEKNKRFAVFNLIWEAVSDMDYYMQYRFDVNIRKEIFGKDWNELLVEDYDELSELIYTKEDEPENDKLSIDEIINDKNYELDSEGEEESDRFHAVINFPNFLLHVLRVQLKDSSVILDDKKLLQTFNNEIEKSKNKIRFVNTFIYNLFKSRYLFDKFIIKREYINSKEQWSLKTLKRYSGTQAGYVNTFGTDDDWDNETIIMLLSMFHVSTPTMIYKHWLNAVLFYLNENYTLENEIDSEQYILYLENFAKNLLLHRFLSDTPEDYFDLIYKVDDLDIVDRKIQYEESKLSYGTIENNLVFNFLDYILWKEDYVIGLTDFEFTFRSSVEHFFPQNPIGGEPIKDKNILHSFGNLFLISHSKNSKLNNHLPSAKKNYYNKSGLKIDSIKQSIMMKDYDLDNWNKDSILDHNKKMIDVFNDFIKELT